MTRRKRTDSVAGQIAVIEELQTPIKSPIKLTALETEVFDGIIEGLPRSSWNKQAIRLASSMAKMTVRAEQLLERINEEGDILINSKGTPVANPLINAMQQAYVTVQTLTRTLGLSASQRGVSESSTKKQLEAEAGAKKVIDKSNGDELLA